jgi:putative ABC transport system ATP-binding protein
MCRAACPVVAIEGLCKSHGSGAIQVAALRNIHLTIEEGEFVAVMGASGSGKSTLLHLLAGLDRPTSGTVRLDGVDVASLNDDECTLLRRKSIGIVFQSFQLFETLTALENVALPLAISGRPPAEADRRARESLQSVALEHRSGHRPHELSGGEQQRVAIARALVIQPRLLLADEPTGSLDSAQGSCIMSLLRRLVDDRQQTLLLVTHDPSHAALADRILHLRDGCLIQDPQPRRPMASECQVRNVQPTVA